jgi:hypothetical protein
MSCSSALVILALKLECPLQCNCSCGDIKIRHQVLFPFTKVEFQTQVNINLDQDIPKDTRYHILILPEPTIRISLLSGFKRIAMSPALNENTLSDKILSLLFSNFCIFADLI